MDRKKIIEALRCCARGECDVCAYKEFLDGICEARLKHEAANLLEVLGDAPDPALIELQNRLHYYRGMLNAHQDFIRDLKMRKDADNAGVQG